MDDVVNNRKSEGFANTKKEINMKGANQAVSTSRIALAQTAKETGNVQ